MKTISPDRTGLLIVRLWIEPNAREGLRARITQTLDSAGTQETMAAAGNPEDIYAAVRTWVEAFVRTDQLSDATVTRTHEAHLDD